MTIHLQPQSLRVESHSTGPMATATSRALRVTNPSALVGETLEAGVLGSRPVERVDQTGNALYLTGVREALDLGRLLDEGVAAALGSNASFGRAAVLPPPKTPHWTSPGERSWLTMLAKPWFGNQPIFAPEPLRDRAGTLFAPAELSKPDADVHVFAHELSGLVYCTPVDDARKALLARGYRDARIVERNNALALVAVTPDAKAITVTFRGAWHFKTLLAAVDWRPFDDGGPEPVPRGVHRYLGQIREPVNGLVAELLARFPEAKLFVASNSLGGGAALQWVDQELRSGLLAPERVARVVAIGAVPGLRHDRAAALHRTLGGRVDVIAHRWDPVPRLLGLLRAHEGHMTVVDGGVQMGGWPIISWFVGGWSQISWIKARFQAHRLSATTRVFRQLRQLTRSE